MFYCSGYDDYYPPPMMGPPRGMPRGGGGGGGGGMRPRMPPPPSKEHSMQKILLNFDESNIYILNTLVMLQIISVNLILFLHPWIIEFSFRQSEAWQGVIVCILLNWVELVWSNTSFACTDVYDCCLIKDLFLQISMMTTTIMTMSTTRVDTEAHPQWWGAAGEEVRHQ